MSRQGLIQNCAKNRETHGDAWVAWVFHLSIHLWKCGVNDSFNCEFPFLCCLTHSLDRVYLMH